MATKKNNEVEVVEEKVVETPKTTTKKKTAPAKKPARKFEMDELITCRSVRGGSLTHVSNKTGQRYEWSDFGDVCEVEYQDLLYLRASKNELLFGPWIVIENDELLTQWKEIKPLYKVIGKYNTLDEIYDLPFNQFTKVLRELPTDMRPTIISGVIYRLKNGNFDSINKLRAIDDEYGTDIAGLYA